MRLANLEKLKKAGRRFRLPPRISRESILEGEKVKIAVLGGGKRGFHTRTVEVLGGGTTFYRGAIIDGDVNADEYGSIIRFHADNVYDLPVGRSWWQTAGRKSKRKSAGGGHLGYGLVVGAAALGTIAYLAATQKLPGSK